MSILSCQESLKILPKLNCVFENSKWMDRVTVPPYVEV
jgi:hypothetical protein